MGCIIDPYIHYPPILLTNQNFFAVDSVVVFGTLLVLIFLSVVTWSIALFKLWRQVQDRKRNRI